MRGRLETHNWKEIQQLYDSGYSYNDIARIYKLQSRSPLYTAVKKGLLKSRNASESTKLSYILHPRDEQTVETKNKISQSIKEKVKNGNWHYSFSKTRTFSYISKFAGCVRLHGSWEFKFARYLDDNDIKWRRPTERFYYEYNKLKSGSGYYTPDFYLIDQDLWVEIKGYEHERDRAKWKFFPHKLKVLKGKDLVIEYKLDIILESKDKKELDQYLCAYNSMD